jgi:hypothetical protein
MTAGEYGNALLGGHRPLLQVQSRKFLRISCSFCVPTGCLGPSLAMHSYLIEEKIPAGFYVIPSLVAAFIALQLLLIVLLALAVKNDAEVRLRLHGQLFLESPWLWFLVVLLAGGYLPTLIYWFIHYSPLRYRAEKS